MEASLVLLKLVGGQMSAVCCSVTVSYGAFFMSYGAFFMYDNCAISLNMLIWFN